MEKAIGSAINRVDQGDDDRDPDVRTVTVR